MAGVKIKNKKKQGASLEQLAEQYVDLWESTLLSTPDSWSRVMNDFLKALMPKEILDDDTRRPVFPPD